jgi:hypothetical protein
VPDETRFGPRPGVADAPSTVQITVVADPAARPLKVRIAHMLALTPRGAGGMVGLAVVVAAAYGLPPRCAAVTMLGNDPTYTRPDFNRASPCARHDAIA